MYLLLGVLIHACKFTLADLVSDFEEAGIVPDVLDNAPNQLFSITYKDKEVLFGEEWTPTDVQYMPSVKWNFEPSSFYTISMTEIRFYGCNYLQFASQVQTINVDIPSREKPMYREFVHWLVTNIPGNDFSKGETIVEYAGSGPPKDGGIHRILFLVYKQPEKLSFNETYTSSRKLGIRLRFSQRKFSKKYNMGNPIAGNMFLAQFDDYVPILHKEFLGG